MSGAICEILQEILLHVIPVRIIVPWVDQIIR